MQEPTNETPREARDKATGGEEMPRRGYRPREIARMFGLAPATVYAHCSEGRLKFHRVGRAIVIPASAVEEWLTTSAREGVDGILVA